MTNDQTTRNPVEMVDISQKPAVSRQAEALGEIHLQEKTVEAIMKGEIKKGDVLAVAEVAGILAVKKTAEILPLCHPIPVLQANIYLEIKGNRITSRCRVTSDYRTGVEMETLLGVTTSLLTIWDMVKYLEKDDHGQYPYTRIEGIKVVKKWKN